MGGPLGRLTYRRARAGAQADSIEAYIAGRLAGAIERKWLDAQQLGQIIRSAELLGTALAFAPHDVFEALSDTERGTAIRCGWRYVSRGERGLRRAFRILEARHSHPRRPDRGPVRHVFGDLLREAHASHMKMPLWEILEDYILEMTG